MRRKISDALYMWNVFEICELGVCYTGCLKKFAIIGRTQDHFSGFIYLMCRVLAHIYWVSVFDSIGFSFFELKKAYNTCIVRSHEKKENRFILFHYYFKMLQFPCFTMLWIPSKVILRHDLLEHVKDNTLIIIYHYSVCVIYDLSKTVDLLNYWSLKINLPINTRFE